MASPMISSPVTTSVRAPKRKKNKKQLIQTEAQNGSGSAPWKSSARHQAYSTNLLRALRQVSIGSAPPRRQAVREVADRALAVAAKGRTRWSRAILQTRLRLKFAKVKRVPAHGSSWTKKPRVSILRLRSKSLPAVQRKVRVLGRLVPGCRKEGVPVILEEAADYIAALQMQVRAMSALAELLSGSGSRSSTQDN